MKKLNKTSGTLKFRINIIQFNKSTKEKTIIEQVGEYTSKKFAEEMYDLVVFDPKIHDKELVMVTNFLDLTKEEYIVLLTTVKD